MIVIERPLFWLAGLAGAAALLLGCLESWMPYRDPIATPALESGFAFLAGDWPRREVERWRSDAKTELPG